MTRPARQRESRSLRVYARLLELYPPAFLQRHRAEMLQNFTDFEDAAASNFLEKPLPTGRAVSRDANCSRSRRWRSFNRPSALMV
jgi:hypothetical protein